MVKIGWKMSFLDVKYWKSCKNTEIRLPHMRAKYFCFLSQTNSVLKITRDYLCTKFGENLWKIAPTSVDERENIITAEVDRRTVRACAPHKSVWAVMVQLMRHLSVPNLVKIG